MKQIKINYIHYKNFKGLKDFKLELEGKDAIVSARNKTGKTTLYDGFYWLLFDKNSQEQSQFKIKPFDNAGEDISGIDTSVESEMTIDGVTIVLKKELKEKWTHPKNSIEKVRGKDSKTYFINGIPTKTKKEYTEFINNIIEEQSFKLLTNPAFFASKGWDERRTILLDLVDEVSVEEVVASDPDYQPLVEPLHKSSLEEFKNGLKYEIKELQKQEKDVSTRLDEGSTNIPIIDASKEQLDDRYSKLEIKMNQLQTEQTEIMNGGTVSKLKKEIQAIESSIHEARMKFSSNNQLTVESLQKDLNDISGRYRAEKENLFELDLQIERLEKKLKTDQEERDVLLEKYHGVKAQTFDEHSKSCATCGQELPEGQIETLMATFHTKKSKQLEEIKEKGSQTKKDIVSSEAELKELAIKKEEYSKKVQELTQLGKECKAELDRVMEANGTFEDSKEYEALMEKGMDIQGRITEEQDSKQAMIAGMEEERLSLSTQKEEVSEQLSLLRQVEQQKERVKELLQKRKEIVDAFNERQGQLFLSEEFFKTKIKLQEEKVNSLFSLTDFVFFGKDANGDEKEMCSITVEGSDYHTNLNNASKINSGLDIIHTLSKQYEITAPIFIDNAEGVNDLFETDSQMISLVVSTDPVFKVEVK